jgi:signal transduction histidine kinase/HPt (histidine-containing phosphotransfer) domain-containing protein
MTERPLRGRNGELELLRTGLADDGVRLILISGPGGVGKSALAAAAAQGAGAAQPLVGRGHFEVGGASRVSPLLVALEAAVEQALSELYDPEAALSTLGAVLGETAVAFSALPPGPLRSLSRGLAAGRAPVSAEAGAARVAEAVIRTIQWLQPVRRGVVLILDDWGRGGASLAALVQRLLLEPIPLTLVATERDEEPGTVGDGIQPLRIRLAALDPESRVRVLADRLGGDGAVAAQVAEFLGEAAALPFDLEQQLAALREGGALEPGPMGWNFHPARIANMLGNSIAENIVSRLLRAPAGVQDVARTLVLFGDEARLPELAATLARGGAAVEDAVDRLEALGVAERPRRGAVRFTHDRVASAIADAMTAPDRRKLARRVGDALQALGATPAAAGAGKVMLRCRLLAGVGDCDPATWRLAFLDGAVAARMAGDSDLAADWAEAALLLARRLGAPASVDLREAAFAALAHADPALAVARADEMLAVAVGAKAEAEAYEMAIFLRRASGDIEGAIALANIAVAHHGLRVPQRAKALSIGAAAVRALFLDPKRIARRPRMDLEALDARIPLARALSATGSLLYERDPMLAMLFATRALPARLAASTPAGAGAYSAICTAFGFFQRGEGWAELSDALQSPGEPMRAMALQYSTNFGFAMVRPRQSASARLEEMERLAYAEGDLAVAAYANRRRALDRLFSDATLPVIRLDLMRALITARRLGDEPTLHSVAALNQAADCLAGDLATPWRLVGEHFSEPEFAASPLAEATHLARNVYSIAALLAAAFGAYETSAALYERTRRYFRPPAFQLLAQTWTFATALALYRTGGRPDGWRLRVLQHHARHNPTDHLHRVLLLQAEVLRLKGRAGPAMVRYEAALDAASRSGCRLEAGIVANASAEAAALMGEADAVARWSAQRDQLWSAFGAGAVLQALGAQPAPDIGPHAAEPAGAEDLQRLELAAGRRAAERDSLAKSRLLADVAHELRTPLQGAVNLLQGAAPPDRDEAVSLRATLQHLASVVDDLADMGALEAGGLALASRAFDPVRVIGEVAAMHRVQAGTRPIVVDADSAAGVIGDEVRLRQVVSNLVSNALKYGEGEVKIRLRAEPGPMTRLEIEVTDRGVGVAPDALATIFEPFRRDPSRAEAEGLGLGLPIARRIARAMGGDLTAEPAEVGARFHFSVALPAAEMHAPPTPALRPRRVLLAEDVQLSRKVLHRLLAELGCEVTAAPDGQAAEALWAPGRFDLVVTDERMPGLNGSELARRLRRAGYDGPILILAGSDEPALRETVADMPGVRILRKPVGAAQLRDCLVGVETSPDPAVRVAELRDALGPASAELFGELRGLLPQMVAEVAEGLGAGDEDGWRAAAHRLAGLAAHFGQPELAAAAARLEACADVDGERQRRLMDDIAAVAAAIDWSIYEERETDFGAPPSPVA